MKSPYEQLLSESDFAAMRRAYLIDHNRHNQLITQNSIIPDNWGAFAAFVDAELRGESDLDSFTP